jgi:hypothetical protein
LGTDEEVKARVVPHVTTTDAEIDAAIARAKSYDIFRPRAVSATFDARNDSLKIELATGIQIIIPRRVLQGLEDASARQVASVQIGEDELSLHWESLDVDHYIPYLLEGFLGTRKWMTELGKMGGASRSPAKQAASRKNGRKGGRPPKRPKELAG